MEESELHISSMKTDTRAEAGRMAAEKNRVKQTLGSRIALMAPWRW
jgi:hypothetical protein